MRAENIEPPSWLSATAKKEFKRLTELLLEVELINEADITHLAFYCDAYSQYISFERQIKKYGLWVDGKPNPFIMRKKDMAAATTGVWFGFRLVAGSACKISN
ncbi:phage terminase small subunit P27 family [Bacillus amyloliquefaciens]|uniref:phage terminase small subunit P27 family n=1 Tax=Bacillus amyloliquefaciens TaxID=1390 RepID=UPI0022AECFCE|nr:phage terminase small subunit P27 family [Bacillus amyloliquefaciens]MCZ4248176.1 phage terminase small subunit P27 family [Bacillus amyloliquefaciens]